MSGITLGCSTVAIYSWASRDRWGAGPSVHHDATRISKNSQKKKEIQNVLKKEKERSKNEKAIKPLSLQILKKKEKKKKPISSENQRADEREASNRNVAHGSHGDADNWWTEMPSLTVRTVQVLLVPPSLQTLCSSKRPL
jgi:hypothetical protein